ncbi:Hint domain-containing protein [Streptacidiphilus sp. N1-3]|uniref:Hint domain-containing protein n=1 Tax=Streptacidiphilus alkalitolerans TaxID=3342712 RepID=A0ABV6WVM5_9ACTN
MADGTVKKIKDIKPGDLVLATDPLTGQTVARAVEDLITTPEDKDFTDLTIATRTGSVHLTATSTHPFWVVSYHAWIDAGNLRPGMALRTADGTATTVLATSTFHHAYLTHNLTVGPQFLWAGRRGYSE